MGIEPGRNTPIAGTRTTMNTRRPLRPQEPKLMPVVKLGPEIKARIGEQLRRMYAEVVDQGVPERFIKILGNHDDPTHESPRMGPHEE